MVFGYESSEFHTYMHTQLFQLRSIFIFLMMCFIRRLLISSEYHTQFSAYPREERVQGMGLGPNNSQPLLTLAVCDYVSAGNSEVK